jgi:hypothetical protein
MKSLFKHQPRLTLFSLTLTLTLFSLFLSSSLTYASCDYARASQELRIVLHKAELELSQVQLEPALLNNFNLKFKNQIANVANKCGGASDADGKQILEFGNAYLEYYVKESGLAPSFQPGQLQSPLHFIKGIERVGGE